MTYVLLRYSFGLVYQEAFSGQVTRYCDQDGVTLFIIPPFDDGWGFVEDVNPPRLPWMDLVVAPQ